jgi:tetratricopeptide (TPR) repeat protein/transglutaminase-like putative cysteine protease
MVFHFRRKSLFLVFLLLSPGGLRAEGPEDWPIPRGPSHEQAPYRYDPAAWKTVPKEFLEDAPACILYSGVTNIVEEDGTTETITHEIIRLNSRKSVEKLGEYRTITYDPSYQKIVLHEARVLKADGRTVPVEPKHVQLRDQITDYLVYDQDKQLVISFPKLEVGDAIEVKWTARGKNPEFQGQFFSRYAFGDDHHPVVLDELRVRLPKKRELHYASIGGKVEPEIKDEENWRTYYWHVTNRRELPQDENLPPREELRLEVLCSTFASWDQVLQWKRKLRPDCWQCTPEIQQVVKEVTKDLQTPLEKVRALTYWVRRNIRYVSLGEKHDFTPHVPARVLANRFGDCKDQTQLLAVMLREIGVPVSLATLATQGEGQVVADVPSPWGNHAILLVVIDGKEHWIDPTTTLVGWDFLVRDDRDRLCYVVDPPERDRETGRQGDKDTGKQKDPKVSSSGQRELRLIRTPGLTPECNRIEQNTRLTIGADGSSRSERTSSYYGLAAMGQRDEWLEVPKGERRRAVATELQNSLNQAELKQLRIDEEKLRDFDQPVVARVEFEVPGQFSGDSEREGSITDSQVWSRLLAVNVDYDRQAPLDLGAPFESVHHYGIMLPPGFRLESVPENRSIHSQWGSFNVRVKADDSNPRKLDVEFHTRLEKTRVEPADLAAFRRFQQDVLKHYRVWLTLTPTQDLADATALEEALAQTPVDRASAVLLARLYLAHGKREEAGKVLQTARGQNPNDAELWELTIKAASNLAEKEAAYQELVKRFPDQPKYAIALGEIQVNRGQHTAARRLLEPLTQKGPAASRSSAHYQLARSFFRQNQLTKTLEHLQAAGKEDPRALNTLATHQLLGQVHERLGQADQALAAYRQALQLDPDAEGTLSDLIRLELAAGQNAEALDLLRHYTLLAANKPEDLIKAAGFYLRLGRDDDAFELAQRALSEPETSAPGKPEALSEPEASPSGKPEASISGEPEASAPGVRSAHRILGLVYLHRRDYPHAISHLERADPDAATIEGLIQGYVASGKLTDADKQAERVDHVPEATLPLCRAYALLIVLGQRRQAIQQDVKIPPAEADLWNRTIDRFVCAEHLYESGHSEAEVETLLKAASEKGAELGPLFALRGLIALEKGRLTKALDEAERAIRLSPKEARGFYVRGRVRLERGDNGALDDLTLAAKLGNRREPNVLHWLAAALFRAGKSQEALAAQQEALKLKPNDPDFTEQLQDFQKATKADLSGN